MAGKFDPTTIFPDTIQASRVDDGELKKHNVGWYFQTIPIDPVTNLAAIPYKEAEAYGFFKIDFLHINVYDHFNSKKEIRELVNKEPDWDLLLNEDHYTNLFQISRHYELVSRIKPRSIPELADCIAIIRPGARSLLDAYTNADDVDRKKMRVLIYESTNDKFTFKKSHAHAYAMTVVLQLHVIKSSEIFQL